MGWQVILVCLEGVRVSGCSCLLSCSSSTRTYLLPSVSPYTLYRMIFSSLPYMNNFFQGRLSYRIAYYCTRAWEECSVNAPGVANCRGRFHGNRPGSARCSGRPLGDCTRCIVKLRGEWPCNGPAWGMAMQWRIACWRHIGEWPEVASRIESCSGSGPAMANCIGNAPWETPLGGHLHCESPWGLPLEVPIAWEVAV